MNDFNAIFQLCEAIGTAAFAVSGAMVAIDKGTDIFGVLLMAVFTALGGGTLRDVLIGHFPPRMFTNFHYVLLSCICALTVFILARSLKERYIERERLIEQVNNVFDAIGLGIFAVSGARIGMEAGFADNIFLTTFLGTTTAIGGGMLRDVLVREVPTVLRRELYAVPALIGATIVVVASVLDHRGAAAAIAGAMVCFLIRMVGLRFGLGLPTAPSERDKPDG